MILYYDIIVQGQHQQNDMICSKVSDEAALTKQQLPLLGPGQSSKLPGGMGLL